MTELTTDVAVIGAGTAGLAAYRAAKSAGRRALIIEGGRYGTTCARVGCMPSKLLIAPAEAAHAVERFPAFGLGLPGDVTVDGKAVMARVRSERDRFVGFVLDGVERLPAADKVRGHARFVDDTTLVVSTDPGGAPHTTVHAGRIVIAAGSSPNVPPPWRALGDRLVVNDDGQAIQHREAGTHAPLGGIADQRGGELEAVRPRRQRRGGCRGQCSHRRSVAEGPHHEAGVALCADRHLIVESATAFAANHRSGSIAHTKRAQFYPLVGSPCAFFSIV